MQIRRREQIGIALEEAAGTAVAPTHNLPFLEMTLEEKHEPFADNQGRGRRYKEGENSIEGRKSAEGKISCVLDPDTAPYWLAMALGSIESAANDESGQAGYKHTIVLTDENDPQTATIWRDRKVDQVEYTNCVCSSLEISFSDDLAKVSADIKAKFPTTQARSIAEVPLKYYTFRNASVSFGDGGLQVRDFSIKIENDAEMIYGPNSSVVDKIAVKSAKVSGSFKLLFENETMKDQFFNFNKDSLSLILTGDDGSSISINLPKVRIDKWGTEGGLDDLVKEGLDFVAEYDTDSDAAITCEVVNSVANYKSES